MITQDCIFCKFVTNEIPVQKIYENDLVLVFPSNVPAAETHLLALPKKHIANFMSVDDLAVWNAMRQAAQDLIREFELEKGYKLLFNGGSYQEVPHLHWHILGGKLTRHL